MKRRIKHLFLSPVLIAGLTSAILLHPETAAGASTIHTVTTLTDETDGSDNLLSLREAILASGPDSTINFAVTGTITLTNELPIGRNLTIIGPGANLLTVSGNNLYRVFSISSGTTVIISGLSVSNGRVVGATGISGVPGADAQGGGIVNHGTLSLNNCTLNHNYAVGGNGGSLSITINADIGYDGGKASGGGIWNNGTLSLANCTLSLNSAGGGQSGAYNTVPFGKGGDADGGGIDNALGGTLSLRDCSCDSNSASGGHSGVDLRSPFIFGFAGGFAGGGGIANHGTQTLVNCTFSGNSATGGTGGTYESGGTGGSAEGGGIWNDQLSLTLVSCSFSGNSVTGAKGGSGDMYDGGTGGHAFGGGVFDAGSGNYRNSIIANGTAIGGAGGAPHDQFFHAGDTGGALGIDVYGPVSSQGHNFVGKIDGSSGWVSSDLTGTTNAPFDPQFGRLKDNGGPTFTMALLPGSEAIDAGDDTLLNAPLNLMTDQRGVPRKIGSHVDIGAFEYDPPQQGPNYVVTTLDDHYDEVAGVGDCTLSEAVIAANIFAGAHIITFAPGLHGTIRLTQGAELGINSFTSIIGPTDRSITISGNHTTRVFDIFHFSSAHTVSIANLNITEGQPGSYGGGIYVDFQQTLNLNNCTIYGNVSSGSGGGLANNGSVFATNCTFSGNQAHEGGGIYTYAGPVLLRNCTVCSNMATVNGGGLYNYNIAGSVFTLGSTLLANNTAGSSDPDVVSDPGDPFISLGYNLIGKGDLGYGFTNGVNHDQVGSIAIPLNPQLGALADNGGPTFTHALLIGSPAIDKGGSDGPATDQRGRTRPYDFSSIPNSGSDGSDIGAFELVPGSPLLNIARSANNVVLSWSTNDSGYTLESKTNLSPVVLWATVPDSPAIVGGQYTVTNSAATGNKYYRLKE